MKNILNCILNYIPGFRSNVLWKKIVASVYYLVILTALTNSFWLFLFFFSIPFLVFYTADLIRHKKLGLSFQKAIIPFAVALVFFVTGAFAMPTEDTANKQTNKATTATTATTEVKESTSTAKPTATPTPTVNPTPTSTSSAENTSTAVSGDLKVHYINVGQGDSELIQQGNQTMLIDAGTNASTGSLIAYLHSLNIKKIDYLILTHPHEDHIGGADAVINDFDIGTIYMPKKAANTKTFKDVLTAISNKGLKISQPALGSTFNLGSAKCTIFGPINSEGDDLNTYSIVVKLTYGNNKFLFTGDAQASNEQGMISKGYDLSADVLKVGHHGSHTSTSPAFLSAVHPKYAVISCGKGNSYGHPHKETLNTLAAANVQAFRTDLQGTIIVTSNCNTITFNTKATTVVKSNAPPAKSNSGSGSSTSSKHITTVVVPAPIHKATPKPAPAKPSGNDPIVYVTDSGKKYHCDGCRSLKKSKHAIKLSEAKSEGYTPCSLCNPPQ